MIGAGNHEKKGGLAVDYKKAAHELARRMAAAVREKAAISGESIGATASAYGLRTSANLDGWERGTIPSLSMFCAVVARLGYPIGGIKSGEEAAHKIASAINIEAMRRFGSYAKAADKMGLHENTLANYRSGGIPRLDRALQCADALGMSLDELARRGF